MVATNRFLDVQRVGGRRDLAREHRAAIRAAREAAALVRSHFGREVAFGPVAARPTAEVDKAADALLAEVLLGEFPTYGWLSEESPIRDGDGAGRQWVVDPLDGTREFVLGISEFAVSVALAIETAPVVAALVNPALGHLFDAVAGRGARRDGVPVHTTSRSTLDGALVLASRSEVERGEWGRFRNALTVRAMGSVAHKLALVAAGDADATFTLVPKHTWDVAAGVLLVREAGGVVTLPDGRDVPFDAPGHLLPGLVASNGHIHDDLLALINGRPAAGYLSTVPAVP